MQRQRTPTARDQLDWINGTYGLGKQIDEWSNTIVQGAGRKERPPTEVSLDTILDELDSLANVPSSAWALTAKRFIESGWLDRLKIVRALIAQRSPVQGARGHQSLSWVKRRDIGGRSKRRVRNRFGQSKSNLPCLLEL